MEEATSLDLALPFLSELMAWSSEMSDSVSEWSPASGSTNEVIALLLVAREGREEVEAGEVCETNWTSSSESSFLRAMPTIRFRLAAEVDALEVEAWGEEAVECLEAED